MKRHWIYPCILGAAWSADSSVQFESGKSPGFREILGTYAANMEELVEALNLMCERSVDVTSWVESISLECSVEAFHRMAIPSDGNLKAVFVS